jgi:hypothetical protein
MKHILILLLLLATVPACTVTPEPVVATQASYDGAEKNSGVIASAPGGYIITTSARDRYNALISRYGKEQLPPVKTDFGLTRYVDGQNYFLTKEGMVLFINFSDRYRSETPVPK